MVTTLISSVEPTAHTETTHFLGEPIRVPLTTAQITGRACVFCGENDACLLAYVGWLRVPLGDTCTSSPVSACKSRSQGVHG